MHIVKCYSLIIRYPKMSQWKSESNQSTKNKKQECGTWLHPSFAYLNIRFPKTCNKINDCLNVSTHMGQFHGDNYELYLFMLCLPLSKYISPTCVQMDLWWFKHHTCRVVGISRPRPSMEILTEILMPANLRLLFPITDTRFLFWAWTWGEERKVYSHILKNGTLIQKTEISSCVYCIRYERQSTFIFYVYQDNLDVM